MTTKTKDEVLTTGLNVPEVLTEEHHEAIRASWELPAYEREAPVTPAKSHRALYAGLLAGALGLAAGFGAGYWAHSQTVEAVTPIVITRQAGPVDANGLNLGRRLAPIETTLPIGITMGGPVDANGAPLGRRVAPLETQLATEVTPPVPVDANGMTLGRRVAPLETQVAGEVPVTVVYPDGLYGGRPAPLE